jgi:hypothetical protein
VSDFFLEIVPTQIKGLYPQGFLGVHAVETHVESKHGTGNLKATSPCLQVVAHKQYAMRGNHDIHL